MSNKLTVIIEVANLPIAEKLMPDVAKYIGPYLDGLNKGNLIDFYDEILNEEIDPEDPDEQYVKSKEGKMDNFFKVCDELETAISSIKCSMNEKLLPPMGYNVIESKKITKTAVAIVLIPEPPKWVKPIYGDEHVKVLE